MSGNGTGTLAFTVSENMVEGFCRITGDRSSLHTDGTFARRTMYRQRVAHGMLPVMCALFLPEDSSVRCRKLSVRFNRPVFIGDAPEFSWARSDAAGGARYDFSLRLPGAGTAAAEGFVLFGSGDGSAAGGDAAGSECMVTGGLVERDAYLPELPVGTTAGFPVCITAAHADAMCALIAAGLSGDSPGRGPVPIWGTDLLAAALTSTFTGMCVPGRHATFLSTVLDFDGTAVAGRTLVLDGSVAFASESAGTIVSDISISDGDGAAVHGKITSRVSEPPRTMPGFREVKERCGLGLADRSVLVTGASRGIGEVIAKYCAGYGAAVYVNYRNGHDDAERVVAEITAGGGTAFPVRADVSDPVQVADMFRVIRDAGRGLDVLVNNAVGDYRAVPVGELTWEDIAADINTVVRGAFNCCREAVTLMAEGGGGRIVNISTEATERPPAGHAKYVIAKSGLTGLTRSLAVEYAERNVLVNEVVPSLTETDLTSGVPRILLDGMRNDAPLGRLAAPDDIAQAVVFLASSLSGYVSGQRTAVTGGAPPFL